jgi:hypothetical protein
MELPCLQSSHIETQAVKDDLSSKYFAMAVCSLVFPHRHHAGRQKVYSSVQNAKVSIYQRKSAWKCKPAVLGENVQHMTGVHGSGGFDPFVKTFGLTKTWVAILSLNCWYPYFLWAFARDEKSTSHMCKCMCKFVAKSKIAHLWPNLHVCKFINSLQLCTRCWIADAVKPHGANLMQI